MFKLGPGVRGLVLFRLFLFREIVVGRERDSIHEPFISAGSGDEEQQEVQMQTHLTDR